MIKPAFDLRRKQCYVVGVMEHEFGDGGIETTKAPLSLRGSAAGLRICLSKMQNSKHRSAQDATSLQRKVKMVCFAARRLVHAWSFHQYADLTVLVRRLVRILGVKCKSLSGKISGSHTCTSAYVVYLIFLTC